MITNGKITHQKECIADTPFLLAAGEFKKMSSQGMVAANERKEDGNCEGGLAMGRI